MLKRPYFKSTQQADPSSLDFIKYWILRMTNQTQAVFQRRRTLIKIGI